MNIRQIRYFLAVAEELNFTRAAEKLHMAQPPLSQQIKQFEEELDVKLFCRNNRQISLTPAGEALVPLAQEVIEKINFAKKTIRQADQGITGQLKIGFISPLGQSLVPQVCKRFKKNYPNTLLQLNVMTPHQIVRAIQQDEINVGLLHGPVPATNTDTITLATEPLVWAISQEHPLSRKDCLTIENFTEEPMVFFGRMHGPGLFDTVYQVFRKHNFSPNLYSRVKSYPELFSYIAAGLGWSMIPSSYQESVPPGITCLPFNDSKDQLEVVSLQRSGYRNNLLDHFIGVTQSYLQQA